MLLYPFVLRNRFCVSPLNLTEALQCSDGKVVLKILSEIAWKAFSAALQLHSAHGVLAERREVQTIAQKRSSKTMQCYDVRNCLPIGQRFYSLIYSVGLSYKHVDKWEDLHETYSLMLQALGNIFATFSVYTK